jgi:hypothetical protein
MGNFLKGWTERLGDGKPFSDRDARSLKKLLRVVVFGARVVMREFTRLRNVAKGDAKELRQTSIVQYTAPPVTVKATKKTKDRDPLAGPLPWTAGEC